MNRLDYIEKKAELEEQAEEFAARRAEIEKVDFFSCIQIL